MDLGSVRLQWTNNRSIGSPVHMRLREQWTLTQLSVQIALIRFR